MLSEIVSLGLLRLGLRVHRETGNKWWAEWEDVAIARRWMTAGRAGYMGIMLRAVGC